MEQYSFIGFLITCVLGLSGFIVWLVKKLIVLIKECTESMKDLKNAVYNNTTAAVDNAESLKELKNTIILINNK